MSTDLVLSDTALPEEPSSQKWKIPVEALPAIAQRYQRGESLRSIAASFGATDEAVRKRLEKWAVAGQGDQTHQELVTEYLVENALEAKDRIVKAQDAIGVARAREETKFWQWMLERRRPKLFGQKHEFSEDNRVQVIVQR